MAAVEVVKVEAVLMDADSKGESGSDDGKVMKGRPNLSLHNTSCQQGPPPSPLRPACLLALLLLPPSPPLPSSVLT